MSPSIGCRRSRTADPNLRQESPSGTLGDPRRRGPFRRVERNESGIRTSSALEGVGVRGPSRLSVSSPRTAA